MLRESKCIFFNAIFYKLSFLGIEGKFVTFLLVGDLNTCSLSFALIKSEYFL
jgi:hypothetical protein